MNFFRIGKRGAVETGTVWDNFIDISIWVLFIFLILIVGAKLIFDLLGA